MGRKEKLKAKTIEHGDDNSNGASTPSLVFSSDDEEANQDLSLKIVEKALKMRATKLTQNDDVLKVDVVPPSQKPELAAAQNDSVLDGLNKVDASEVTEKKETKLKVEAGDQSVVIAQEQEMEETIKVMENHESVEGSLVQIGDNMVLRKLLRGPRYFDPPDSSWGACFHCGEQGHIAVNCTAAKRKKPCYVCGGLGHNAKQCSKVQDCFICKQGGHRAKDCPEKNMSAFKSVMICLKCGNSGHDMFSCKNDYALDDLKEIQCYVCKRLGHLCCVNTDDATPGEISCYKCGQLGHTGLACSRLREETTSGASPSSCFRCGEEGHFARECMTLIIKPGKRNRESSNRKDKRSQNENDMGYRSAPYDLGKNRKKKWSPTEEERGFSTPKKSKSSGGWTMGHHTEDPGFTTTKKSKSRGGWTTEHPTEGRGFMTPKKSKSRGGWRTEHPREFSPSMSNRSSWRSSGIPSSKSTNFHSFGNGSHTSNSPSSRSTNFHSLGNGSHTPNSKSSVVWNGDAGTSKSQGSANANHQRFLAPRSGYFANNGKPRKKYDLRSRDTPKFW